MTPRERTGLRLGVESADDIIHFYNQVGPAPLVFACGGCCKQKRAGAVCPALCAPRACLASGPVSCAPSRRHFFACTPRVPSCRPQTALLPQVFIPHAEPFLRRLAENPSLLDSPPPSVLPYLLNPHGQQQQLAPAAGGTPPSPSRLRSVSAIRR